MKKDLRAVEQKRPDVALARDVWINRRQPFMRNMLTRLAFIDVETEEAIDPGDHLPRRGSLKTNMVKTTGWSPCGARLVDHAPSDTGWRRGCATGSSATPTANLHRRLAP